MGTRSDIIVHMRNGKWARIYCHWDGYLEHNGRILFDHYTSQNMVERLIALGDLSSLGAKIGVKHPFDKPRIDTPAYAVYQRKYADMCLAYGRDRGEKDAAADVFDSLAAAWPPADTWTEFTYVWTNGKWHVASANEGAQTLVDLGEALLGQKPVTPAVKAFGMVIGQHNATTPAKPHGWHGD